MQRDKYAKIQLRPNKAESIDIKPRGEPITNTPKVIVAIHDSIKLARMVLRILNSG